MYYFFDILQIFGNPYFILYINYMGFNQFINNGGGIVIAVICVVGLISTPFIGNYIQSKNNNQDSTGGTRHKKNKINKSRRKRLS